MKYSIDWRWNGQPGNYVGETRSKPYTTKLSEAKVWTTQRRAENWLMLKDPTWASQCVVVENPEVS